MTECTIVSAVKYVDNPSDLVEEFEAKIFNLMLLGAPFWRMIGVDDFLL